MVTGMGKADAVGSLDGVGRSFLSSHSYYFESNLNRNSKRCISGKVLVFFEDQIIMFPFLVFISLPGQKSTK